MLLPRGDEYNLAIQNPTTAFNDPVLKTCQAETTPLGLPKPYSGGFTVTYHLKNTPESWAARCFTRDIPDLQQRYQAISRFIEKHPGDIFVDATFLNQGIQVNSKWYPIIKMAWLAGEPLNFYIENNIHNTQKVAKLALAFQVLVKSLEKSGIAHGDLQHGNIVVKNDKLYLIDYDGLYLPELAPFKSNNIGHPNYQHPQRTLDNYDSSLDRFSEIVIYLGLAALAIKPGLWATYSNSENILFKQQDILDPDNSPLLKDLKTLPSFEPLIERFKDVCKLDFSNIPSLEQFLAGAVSKTQNSNFQNIPHVVRSFYPIIDARKKNSLLEYVGQRIEVIGEITDSKQLSRYGKTFLFLNFGDYPNQTFYLVLWSKILETFEENNINPRTYINKWVSVTGVITTYNGKPQMEIEVPSQIQALKGEQESKIKLGLIPPPALKLPKAPIQTSTSKPPIEKQMPKAEPVYPAFPSQNTFQNQQPKAVPNPPQTTQVNLNQGTTPNISSSFINPNKTAAVFQSLYSNRPVSQPGSNPVNQTTPAASLNPGISSFNSPTPPGSKISLNQNLQNTPPKNPSAYSGANPPISQPVNTNNNSKTTQPVWGFPPTNSSWAQNTSVQNQAQTNYSSKPSNQQYIPDWTSPTLKNNFAQPTVQQNVFKNPGPNLMGNNLPPSQPVPTSLPIRNHVENPKNQKLSFSNPFLIIPTLILAILVVTDIFVLISGNPFMELTPLSFVLVSSFIIAAVVLFLVGYLKFDL